MPPPQQPTELIDCTASVCSQEKARMFTSRYVNLSLTCLTDSEDDEISIEPRAIDHNTRAQESQLFTVSSSLVLATITCESWIMSPIYKLMNDSEHGHRARSPRGHSTPVSALHTAIAYTIFMAPSHQTTQQKTRRRRNGLITGADIRSRTSLHRSLRRLFFMAM
jgi:hypothetical protein